MAGSTRQSKTSPQRVRLVEKHLQALELRKTGFTYAEIALNLGYRSPSGAEKAVRSAIRKVFLEPATEVLKIELFRLDALLQAIWQKAKDGDYQAVDRVLRIMERRAKLLGLDAATPLRVEAEFYHTPEQAQPKASEEWTAGVLRILVDCGAFGQLVSERVAKSEENGASDRGS